MAESIVLYRHKEAWGLPSSSSASIQVEAYIRFSGAPFNVKACASSSKSPTGDRRDVGAMQRIAEHQNVHHPMRHEPAGQLPAVEKDNEIGGGDASRAAKAAGTSSEPGGVLGEFRAAQLSMDFARRHIVDLDQHLTSAQKAELLAYRVLIQTRLEVATMWSAWCEPLGYAEIRKVMAQLPFPLSYIIPWTQRKEVMRRFGGIDAYEMYADAAAALTALADRLKSSGGAFFFGSRPSSLDAVLVGHLIYFRLCPAAPPVLQQKVSNLAVLSSYVDYVMREYFSVPALPQPPRQPPPATTTASEGPSGPSWGSSSWSDGAKGSQKAKPEKTEPTPAEKLFRRNSRLWLLGAGAAILAYVLLSGQYVRVADLGSLMTDNDDDDDDDEGGDE